MADSGYIFEGRSYRVSDMRENAFLRITTRFSICATGRKDGISNRRNREGNSGLLREEGSRMC